MSVESLQQISGAFYIAAGILFAVSVILFFLLRIWQVLGDLTGRTARKGIESIRKENASGEGGRYKRRDSRPVRRMERREIGNTEKFMTEELSKMHENATTLLDNSMLSEKRYEPAFSSMAPEVKNALTQAEEEVSVELMAELGFCESTEIIE